MLIWIFNFYSPLFPFSQVFIYITVHIATMKSSKNAASALQKCLLQYRPQLRTYAKVIRQQDPEDFKNMPIFQYRTENSKKKKRIYMWGNAMFGALGNANFVKPVRHKHPLESMRRPCRLSFADLHKVKEIFIS